MKKIEQYVSNLAVLSRAKNEDITHIYNEAADHELVAKILDKYISVFITMQSKIKERYGEELKDF